jgi:Fe-S-cluster containining protein
MKYKTIYLKAVLIEHDHPIANVPCQTINCTECCEKLSPYLTEQEFASGKYVYTFLNGGDPDKPVIAVPKTERGCFYLSEDKKCSIYSIRPMSCRQFDCRENHHHLISNKFEEK